MTIFSSWLDKRAKKIGGIEGLVRLMPEQSPQDIAAWFTGLRQPGYRAQIELSEAIGEPLSMVRSHLGQPYTAFSELIARAILKRGSFTGFCKKVGINKSRLDKWLGEGKLPLDTKLGVQSKDLIMICDALVMWGDDTPPSVLIANLALAIKGSIAAKEVKKVSKKSC